MQRKFSMVKKGSLPAQAKGRDDLYDVAFSMLDACMFSLMFGARWGT
ncbi:MAG: hypothetical protein U5N55_07015 [Cypionkella sp.]|nr:hypothetical protein [Cypionkella sp.]